jgi:hypothetical protein
MELPVAKWLPTTLGVTMIKKTNRREFVQIAGVAASGLLAAARPVAAAAPEPQPRAAPRTMGARFRALMDGPEPAGF